jgi:hypothetical protein
MVDLELVPHPGITWAEAVEADYGMEGGVLRVKTRAATLVHRLDGPITDWTRRRITYGFEIRNRFMVFKVRFGTRSRRVSTRRDGLTIKNVDVDDPDGVSLVHRSKLSKASISTMAFRYFVHRVECLTVDFLDYI